MRALLLFAAGVVIVFLRIVAFIRGGGEGLTLEIVADRLQRKFGWTTAQEE
jgi:hypothetical protein